MLHKQEKKCNIRQVGILTMFFKRVNCKKDIVDAKSAYTTQHAAIKKKTEEALTTFCNFDAIIIEGAM